MNSYLEEGKDNGTSGNHSKVFTDGIYNGICTSLHTDTYICQNRVTVISYHRMSSYKHLILWLWLVVYWLHTRGPSFDRPLEGQYNQ